MTTRRKLVTRYTGDKGTAHRRIANGTIEARPGNVFLLFVTGLNKGYALEVPLSDLKYRGNYVSTLPDADYLSADR
jgi:hypothetical protein